MRKKLLVVTPLLVAAAAFFLVAQDVDAKGKGKGKGKGKKAMAAPAGHIAASAVKWIDGPPSLPPGAQMALLYGDPKGNDAFTMRLKFPANYKIPAHWHPTDERITILSGVLHFGLGKKLDEKKTGPLGAGAHGWVKAKEAHFAYTKKEEVILQLDARAPWGITYIDAKDDPRKRASK